jgi:hypothetical protein
MSMLLLLLLTGKGTGKAKPDTFTIIICFFVLFIWIRQTTYSHVCVRVEERES